MKIFIPLSNLFLREKGELINELEPDMAVRDPIWWKSIG